MERPEAILDSERRDATVVFADISGFTALSEKLDPEEVTSLINRCFETLETIILTHGGTVDKYLGDCVLAVFGFGPVSADAAMRAVEAAIEVRDAIREFNRTAQVATPLDVHIGINTGPVIAGVLSGPAKHELTVLGDTVNVAAALEDASGKGQICVGPQTYHETAGEFEYRPLPPLPIGGRREPLPIYEVVGPRPSRRIRRDSERRLATVLFADVLGLQSLAEQMEAEALTSVMNRCFSSLAIAVVSHGGVVDKYVGEGLMALFGVPNAIESAPKQAINAAIDIRNRVARFNDTEPLPVRLEARVGINTGLVIAGDIGGRLKRDFTVMGDAVNLAARLKEAAGRGVICVGTETHRYTRDDFEFRTLEPLALKGKEHLVPAYEVLSVTRRIQRPVLGRSDRMIFSEMVGRDAELAVIKTRMANLVEGHGGIVSLSGEAGVGKSRLMAEVLATAEGMTITILEGRALAVGQNLGHHPFVALLRQWARIGDDEAEASAESKLHAAIAALFPDGAGEVFPFIATLMGMHLRGAHAERLHGIAGDALERLIVKGVRELLQAIAARRPLMLVFDDLHWADPSSIELLVSLVRLVTDHPILFINVFRPQSPETAERIQNLAREVYAAYHTEIHLEGLDSVHTDLLVRNLLDTEDLPATTRDLIANRTEGNPFYIEEVVRSLIDQGAVEYQDGRFHVTAKIDSVVIPGTIQDVIMARVDRLDESARQLLQVASVIGRSFYRRIIADVLQRERGLDEDLAALREKQLLFQRAARWSVAVGERGIMEDLEYVFKHALAQETIYNLLLLKTRKELHRRVAHSIEALFDDRLPHFYGMLAYHYTRAEEFEPAQEYLFKAGERAARSAASREALQFFQESARIYGQLHPDGGDPQRRAALEKNIGLALLNKGDLTDSIAHFDRALEYIGERVPKNDLTLVPRFVVDLAAVLFHLYVRPGAHGAARNADHEREVCELFYYRGKAEITSDARRLFLEMPTGLRRLNRVDPETIDQAFAMYVSCAGLFAYSGISFAASRRMLEIGRRFIREGRLHDVFVYRMCRFVTDYFEGSWNALPRIDDQLVTEALRYGYLWDVGTYVGLQGEKDIDQGAFADARKQIEKAAELVTVYSFDFARSNELALTAYLLLEQRHLDGALAAVERYHAERPEPLLNLLALGTKARIQILMDDCSAAEETVGAAEALAARIGQVPGFHQRPYLLARLSLDLVRLERARYAGAPASAKVAARAARRTGRRALSVSRKLARMRPETFRQVGQYYWLCGKPLRAARWWQRSVQEGRRLGTAAELARTYMAVGRRLQERPAALTRIDGIDAPACLEKARAMFTELGLDWDLQRLEVPRPPEPQVGRALVA